MKRRSRVRCNAYNAAAAAAERLLFRSLGAFSFRFSVAARACACAHDRNPQLYEKSFRVDGFVHVAAPWLRNRWTCGHRGNTARREINARSLRNGRIRERTIKGERVTAAEPWRIVPLAVTMARYPPCRRGHKSEIETSDVIASAFSYRANKPPHRDSNEPRFISDRLAPRRYEINALGIGGTGFKNIPYRLK